MTCLSHRHGHDDGDRGHGRGHDDGDRGHDRDGGHGHGRGDDGLRPFSVDSHLLVTAKHAQRQTGIRDLRNLA